MKCRSGADNPRKIGGDNYSDAGGERLVLELRPEPVEQQEVARA